MTITLPTNRFLSAKKPKQFFSFNPGSTRGINLPGIDIADTHAYVTQRIFGRRFSLWAFWRKTLP